MHQLMQEVTDIKNTIGIEIGIQIDNHRPGIVGASNAGQKIMGKSGKAQFCQSCLGFELNIRKLRFRITGPFDDPDLPRNMTIPFSRESFVNGGLSRKASTRLRWGCY